ncbi:MAG TPA: preprotein translocase subunit Sec61beta [Candidatus Methanomethylicus sp.]|mgnify:CR=1 FL=1|nr:preprotein translocase subunit Sec61beta [Candidatus Methanomethylicus sp.]
MPKSERKKDSSPMPMTGAGLIRFFEDETHGIKIKPQFIVGGCIAVMVIVILAHVLTGA